MKTLIFVGYLLLLGLAADLIEAALGLEVRTVEWWLAPILVGVIFGAIWFRFVEPWMLSYKK